jgi:hypothetical protein
MERAVGKRIPCRNPISLAAVQHEYRTFAPFWPGYQYFTGQKVTLPNPRESDHRNAGLFLKECQAFFELCIPHLFLYDDFIPKQFKAARSVIKTLSPRGV